MVDRFERFSFAISEISRYWHKIASDEMERYDLKGPHAIYFTTLYRHPDGVTAARLAELCSRDKADVSRAVSVLKKKGLVKKEGTNLYRARLKLTPQGMLLAEHITQRAMAAVEYGGRGLTEEHRAIFYEALAIISANLQHLSQEGLSPL